MSAKSISENVLCGGCVVSEKSIVTENNPITLAVVSCARSGYADDRNYMVIFVISSQRIRVPLNEVFIYENSAHHGMASNDFVLHPSKVFLRILLACVIPRCGLQVHACCSNLIVNSGQQLRVIVALLHAW